MRLEPAADAFGEQVEYEKARVVPGAFVLQPGVAEADDEMSVVGHGAAQCYSDLSSADSPPPPSSPSVSAAASASAAISASDWSSTMPSSLGGLGHLGLELLGGRGLGDGEQQLLGIADQGRAVGQRDVAGGDLVADLESPRC